MKKKNAFLWVSFLPAIAYWYLEANYDLKTALVGGGLLAILEMLFEWIYSKHIHIVSKLNFFLIIILGGVAFFADEGIWFRLQPAFTGVLMGGYLLYRYYKKDSLMHQMMKDMDRDIVPKNVISLVEKNMAFFLLGYGFFMCFVAFNLSTDKWLFFKTIGFYFSALIFLVIQMILMRRSLR